MITTARPAALRFFAFAWLFISWFVGPAVMTPVMAQEDAATAPSIGLEPLYRTADQDACYRASPLLAETASGPQLLVVSGNGIVNGLDPETGEAIWTASVGLPENRRIDFTATPVIIENRLAVLAFQLRDENNVRQSHHVAVIDFEAQGFAEEFGFLTLTASKPALDAEGTVDFLPSNQFSRAAIAHGVDADGELGRAYVSFGNISDIQPWHGWMFEVDLDRWQAEGAEAAVTGVLLTTPQNQCGEPGRNGSRDTVCGGGIWAPSGPVVSPRGDSYELFVPTGNGGLDLAQSAYSHTIMRMGPGLEFDPGCDAELCAAWDFTNPDEACMSSCSNLFIPRLLPRGSAVGAGVRCMRRAEFLPVLCAPRLGPGRQFTGPDFPRRWSRCHGPASQRRGRVSLRCRPPRHDV